MADMFGAPVGISRAESDIRANKLAELALDKGAVEIETARTKLDANKRMLELMNQQSTTPSSQGYDLSDSMNALAGMALKSGLPEEAREYVNAGANLRRTTSEIDNALFNQKMKHLQLLSNLMAGVHDQQTWAQANAMFKMQTGKDTPFAQQPYDPQTVQNLQRGFATAKDQALTDAAKARQRASVAATDERNARIPLIKAQTDEVRARTAKLKKAGATSAVPKAGDVKMVKDLIINEYGAGVMPEQASMLAQPVAERMLEILKDSNISRSQAAYRAFQEAKGTGHFGGLRQRMQQKGSRANPMDIPTTKDGKADPGKLRANMYYKGVGKYSGQVLLWNGKTFQQPEAEPDTGDVTEQEETADEASEDADREAETGGQYEPSDYTNPDDYNSEDYQGAE